MVALPAVTPWADALLAAECIAVDPVGLGGIRLRASAGPVREAWLAGWRGLIDPTRPVRPVPLHIDDDRLLGGLDLASTLASGRRVTQRGVLAEAAGGFAILAMAERIDRGAAARIASVIDTDGADIGLIALDEGDADEPVAQALSERLALIVDLRAVSSRDVAAFVPRSRDEIARARIGLADVQADDALVEALCAAAAALGIDSMRMPVFALRAARALAALDGRSEVDTDDAAQAVRLIYGPRATTVPAPAEEPAADEPGPPEDAADQQPGSEEAAPEPEPAPDEDETDAPPAPEAMAEAVLEAALASIPDDLLKQLADGARLRASRGMQGSGTGALAAGRHRGSPAGVRRRRPRPPERLSLVETLRAAAPWQRIRRAEAAARASLPVAASRVHVRIEDLHVIRFKQRQATTTVFVVDASGSAALNRLAEAKGAVELLLADCYVRRDSVAVLAFRGSKAELLLPPTRSLVRARRRLAGLPGGGGTPLASALDATRELLLSLRRRGETALAVLLTDGRGNVSRDGTGGRVQAEADALAAARALRAMQADIVLIDTSPQPKPQAARLAVEMGAIYRPLPYAGAAEMSAAVGQVRSRGVASGRA